ncbi:MAG: hypothetical protein ACFFD8_10990 [Candidatus Thorarchaeota archaeon]
MSEILEQVTSYLKAMHLSYEIKPVDGKIHRIRVPYTIPEKKLQFEVVIDVSGQFLRFWVLVLLHNRIRNIKQRERLYHELLLANGQLAEVKYFITEKGDIGVLGHEGVKILNIDSFREEFRAIPYGIIYFVTTIAKKLKLSLKLPTKDELSIYS